MQVIIADSPSIFRQMLQKKIEENGIYTAMCDKFEDLVVALQQKSPSMLVVGANLLASEPENKIKALWQHPSLGGVPVILVRASAETDQKWILPPNVQTYLKSDLATLNRQLENHLKRIIQQNLNGHILYVEDSEVTADAVGRVLTRHGLTYDRFVTVEDALVAFENNTYDLVLTDYFLKGAMTGVDLVRNVRARTDRKAALPILVLTSDMDINRRIEVIYAGASDYMSKPVLYEELIARLSTQYKMIEVMSKLEEKSAAYEKLAVTDHLTGLYNRTGFSGTVQPELLKNLNQTLSAVIFDIDFFKKINDGHGHNVGDKVLQGLGHLILSSLEVGDFGVRFGGEEFLVIKSNHDSVQAAAWAESLRIKLNETEIAGLQVTASIGVSSVVLGQTSDFDSLLQNADQALYTAKTSGRNRVTVFGV